jgi:hypothetical protein
MLELPSWKKGLGVNLCTFCPPLAGFSFDSTCSFDGDFPFENGSCAESFLIGRGIAGNRTVVGECHF